jgi:hypothetical protein
VLFLKVVVEVITLLKRKIVGDVLMMKYGTMILSVLHKKEREREVLKYEAQLILH